MLVSRRSVLVLGAACALPQPAWSDSQFFRRTKWPYDSSAVDLDFINQRYFWGTRQRNIGDFATYALNGSTFGAYGLTPSGTIDLSVTLAAAGLSLPCSFAVLVYTTSIPVALKGVVILTDDTINEDVYIGLATDSTPQMILQVVDNTASQCNFGAVSTGALNKRFGFAGSVNTNDFLASSNGINGTADTAGTLPSPTIIRIGRVTSANSQFPGAISRVVFWNGPKTQPQVRQLSLDIKN